MLLIGTLLSSACVPGFVRTEGQSSALCRALLGGPADSVTEAVLADDEALNGQGSAVLAWDQFLSGFESGCED